MSKAGLGDFQTPVGFARTVWSHVDPSGYDLVVEPTVDEGAFLESAPESALQLPWRCHDLNSAYLKNARKIAKRRGIDARITKKDAFTFTKDDWAGIVGNSRILAIGNPPWVTNAALTQIGFENVPAKLNAAKLPGLDAMTGKSNFDIAEAILFLLYASLDHFKEVRFLFLVKRSVALRMAKALLGTPGFAECSIETIDAKAQWGVSVDACLFSFLHVRGMENPTTEITVTGLGGRTTRAGLVGDRFAGNVSGYEPALEAAPGQSLVWRQGVKHDLAKVLELVHEDGKLRNKLGDQVVIEPEILHPWYKSTDIASGYAHRHSFPLYQKDLKAPPVLDGYPLLKKYLQANTPRFTARKSSIYEGKYPYMLFGVGEYTWAPYKVAVSGLHKDPVFRVLSPDNGKAPLVDDTCYFLPFLSKRHATDVARYLNSSPVKAFLESIVDIGAKRPYTKEVLQRIAIPEAFSPELRKAVISGDATAIRNHLAELRKQLQPGLLN